MKKYLAAILVTAVPMVVVIAEPAEASQCSGSRSFTKVHNESTVFKQASGANSSVTGSTGVMLKISTSTTFTVGGSISGGSELSVGGVIAAVKGSTNVTVQASRSGTTSTSGTWKVPSSYKVGRLTIGANKYKGTVTSYVENKNCVKTKVGTAAKYNAPKREWHFRTTKVS